MGEPLNNFNYYLGYDELDDVNYIIRHTEKNFTKIVLSFNWHKMRENIKISFYVGKNIRPYKVSNYDFETVPEKYVDDVKNLCDIYFRQWGEVRHYRQELISLRMVDFVSTRVEGLPFGGFIEQYNSRLGNKFQNLNTKPIIYGKHQKDIDLHKVKVYGSIDNHDLGLIFSLHDNKPYIEIEDYENYLLLNKSVISYDEAEYYYNDLLNRAVIEYQKNFGSLESNLVRAREHE